MTHLVTYDTTASPRLRFPLELLPSAVINIGIEIYDSFFSEFHVELGGRRRDYCHSSDDFPRFYQPTGQGNASIGMNFIAVEWPQVCCASEAFSGFVIDES